MASTSVLQGPPSQRIPANIIFSPRQFKHYRRWQRLYSSLHPAEQGYLPTALEFDDFHQWLKRQDSGYFSDIFDDIAGHIESSGSFDATTNSPPLVAAICRHNIHPVAAPQKHSRCPVCTIGIHVTYIRALQQTLDSAGGRAPSCTLTASEYQENAYNAWLAGKMGIIRELANLEHLADQEAKWSSEHPDVHLDNVQTATKALDLYWFETDGTHEAKSRSPKKKTVVFAHDTTFQPGRPSAYFWKRSPRYAPGRYARHERLGQDEEYVSEDSEDYFQALCLPPQASQYGGSKYRWQECSAQNELETLDEGDDESDWEDIELAEDESTYATMYDEGESVAGDMEDEHNLVIFAND